MNQKGFAPIMILIALAAIIAVGALAYGYFISAKKAPQSVTTSSGGTNPFEVTSQTNPKDCLDTDYTGCDTSADFMTWKDDGERNPPAESSESTILLK